MKKTISILLFLIAASMPLIVKAMDTGGYYPISKIWAWADYTDGVVLVQLENQNSLCPNGYWFKDSSGAASKNILSIALSAYHAKTPVRVYADENSDWSGLSSKECELKLIVME
ncbi:hypothetical protein KFE80_06065 [bacterium SCSIO 12696]|nr:hypothetical protein KFE80_06065 [bacterium SCSIO 12696]